MIKNFAQAIIEKNILTEESLKKIESGAGSGTSLIYKILNSGLVEEQPFLEFYRDFTNSKYVSITELKPEENLINVIDPEILRRFYCLPVKKVKNLLTILMADPLDYQAIDALEKASGCQINPLLGKFSEITTALDKQYGVLNSVKAIVDDLENSALSPITIGHLDNQIFQTSASAGPINKLLHLILSHALREKASDIHFEQSTNELLCRFRIDGVLHRFMTFPKALANSLVSSIKILAKMDIAEKRLPLDGSFQVKVENKIIDLRVSSFPTIEGEKIVIRVLDKETLLLSLPKVGLSEVMLERFYPLIQKNSGIILVTGPTGSGKTTTLYAALEAIKSVEKNIMTIEDPVEYHLELINQAQVNVKAGLTFAKGLRSFLRQDPDILLVGEIRDRETAEIAFQAALTGHLVFSTLHTNDTASALTRLRDMGIEDYLLTSSTINGVLSQRLVRRICPYCTAQYEPEQKSLKWLELKNDRDYYHGKGCEHCKGTGYLGRIGLFELLILDEEINDLVHQNNFTANAIRRAYQPKGMITFQDDARQKILQNITTPEEVLRILG